MKFLLLLAVTAFAACYANSDQQRKQSQLGPWHVGTTYSYRLEARTLAALPEAKQQWTGAHMKADLKLRVLAPWHLQGRLSDVQHAQVHHELPGWDGPLPEMKYEKAPTLEQTFDFYVSGGRIRSLRLPSASSLSDENLLKGLLGALQVDFTSERLVHSSHNFLDSISAQGVFRKMEVDVTGECETLYSVSPLTAEVRKAQEQNMIDSRLVEAETELLYITKSKNYANCAHRVAYHFGVPEGADWTGSSHSHTKESFMQRSTTSHIVAARDNQTIFSSKVTTTVGVSPNMCDVEKAQVVSQVQATLVDVQQDNEAEWQMPADMRQAGNLLYSLRKRQSRDMNQSQSSSSSSSSSSSESSEHNQEQSNENNSKNQASQEQNLPKSRQRRSALLQADKVNAITKPQQKEQHKRDSSSSSSSSSSSDSSTSTSSDSNENVPHIDEPSYTALHMQADEQHEKKNNPAAAQKLVQEIAQQIQNYNNMPKTDNLSKFNILVRIIAAMNTKQLQQMSRTIENGQKSENPSKVDSWMIYRDAVVQSGTTPAFQQIKTWIKNKQLQGEEAASVIASLATTLRYPTKQVMSEFFKMAMSPEVRQQQYLNSSALLAATRFINMGHVNNKTAHEYYPTHTYGRFASKNYQIVREEILPALRQALEEARERQDSDQAQVYIKAIGNLGHDAILEVFAPYLEGKVPISTYLRFYMVLNLNRLARQHPHLVRGVLYNIYKNTAEHYEVRVAAVTNLMKAEPTPAMLQEMATSTNFDASVQVRSAIKSAIQSAAQLTQPRYHSLAQAARAAKGLLTSQEFGLQYSSKYLNDYKFQEREMGYFQALSYIGSEDSLYPKHASYSWKNQLGGWFAANKISASVSSIRKAAEYVKRSIQYDYENQGAKIFTDQKYTADKIAELLRMNDKQSSPIEGNVVFNAMNQQRMFTFSEQDMQELPHLIRSAMEKLSKGINYHYTKMYNQAQVSIMFPMAMGVPFIFKYKEPTLLHVQGKIQTKQNAGEGQKTFSSIEGEIEFTFARNIDGSVGFLNTLANQYASAGVVKKVQVNFPVKFNVNIQKQKLQVQVAPLKPEQDTVLAHYSVWPYTANQNKDSLTPVSLDPSSKIIKRDARTSTVDTRLGQQSTGMQFQIQGYSQSRDYDNVAAMFRGRNVASGIAFALHPTSVALTQYNVKFLGKQSQTKSATFTIAYDKLFKLKLETSSEKFEAKAPSDVTPDSQTRRQELLNKVAAGLKYADTQVVEFNAVFDGAKRSEYVVCAAIAKSKVDPRVQYAFFYNKNSASSAKFQIAAAGTLKMQQYPVMNFLEILKREVKNEFEADIKYGQQAELGASIHIQGDMQRSQQRKERLSQLWQSKECIREIESGNYLLPVCHEISSMAIVADQLKASVAYKNVGLTAKNWTYQAYSMLHQLGYWYMDENLVNNAGKDGRIEMEAQLAHDEHRFNATIRSGDRDIRITNAPLPKFSGRVLAINAQLSVDERIGNKYFQQQFQPWCAVEEKKIKPFVSKSFDYQISKTWHVIMQQRSMANKDNQQQPQQLVVLARRPNKDQQEAYVSYTSYNGEQLNIELKPIAGDAKFPAAVFVNGEQKSAPQGEVFTYWSQYKNAPLLQTYSLPDAMVLDIEDGRIRVVYDGQRLVVLPSSFYRDTTRGICGSLSGDSRDDFVTAQSTIALNPAYAAASYALTSEGGDDSTKQLQQQAERSVYKMRQYQYSTIFNAQSESQWRNLIESKKRQERQSEQSVKSTKSYSRQRGPCALQQQVQYYEKDGQICITQQPLASCTSRCRGQEYVERSVAVICKATSDQQFRAYREQIRQGENPQLESQAVEQQMFRVPSRCQA